MHVEEAGRGLAHLVLAVYTRLDLTRLDERNDLPLEGLDGPPEGLAHTLEPDRREWLEVLDQRLAPDQVRQRENMRRDVHVKVVACLTRYLVSKRIEYAGPFKEIPYRVPV